jgi:DNA-binding NtrC family response regulator
MTTLTRFGDWTKTPLCVRYEELLRLRQAVLKMEVAESSRDSRIDLKKRVFMTNGLTLLRRLRVSGSALPLMLITGHGDISMAVTAALANKKPLGTLPGSFDRTLGLE